LVDDKTVHFILNRDTYREQMEEIGERQGTVRDFRKKCHQEGYLRRMLKQIKEMEESVIYDATAVLNTVGVAVFGEATAEIRRSINEETLLFSYKKFTRSFVVNKKPNINSLKNFQGLRFKFTYVHIRENVPVRFTSENLGLLLLGQ